MTDHKPSVTTREVLRLTGLTARQIQWWDEQGIIPALSIEGHRRRYSHQQVKLLKAVQALRAKAVTLQRCRTLIRQLEQAIHWRARYIVVRERWVECARNANELADCASKARGPVWVVKL